MDGIIVVNKEKGCTSHDVVYKIKKIFGEKVGHTGTLDPNATGVLPILIGQGTKLSYYLINHDKEYVVTLELGIKTDTADIEGNVIEKRQVDEKVFDKNIVESVLKTFLGKQKQIPPIYSAIKVNGKKLYEYAREKRKVEIKPREIEIYDIELINILRKEKQIDFRVKCSKGTYIRSLCEDIAQKLGTIGYMKELKRTIVGDFEIEKSVTIEELEKNKENKNYLENNIITIENFFKTTKSFDNSLEISLNEKELGMFLNGVKLEKQLKNGLYRIYTNSEKFIGIGLVENNLLKREIIT